MNFSAGHLVFDTANHRSGQNYISNGAEPDDEDLFQTRIFYKSKTSVAISANFVAMILTDTHAHLYLNAFDDDRHDAITNAIAKGVRYLLLPNIDKDSITPMMELVRDFPGHCFPMMGLHPTSVKEDFEEQLEIVKDWLKKEKFCAIGEMGIDLYWDKTYFPQQQEAFRVQAGLAMEYGLPLVIHSRESFTEIFRLLDEVWRPGLKGVFHCFTGNLEQAQHIIDLGFRLGIGGVLTYKNSGLPEVIKEISAEHLLLETDAPFLAPVPYRGKRNESSYIPDIAQKIAEIKNTSLSEIARITTQNAINFFNLPPLITKNS
jgi:TatD DNase family protein